MNDIMFKTNIREFDYKLDIKTKEEIIYRVISINNTYFFAEEISTGCIFPIYYFEHVKNNSSYKGGTIFQTHSNVKYGKYFVFADLSPTDKPFQFKVNTSNVKWIKPSIDEVNQYLEEKKKDINWIYLIKTMEELNKYNCDLSLIKSILAAEKEKQSLN